ncbi:maltase A3-like [Adelges cooleyi]|uniref:maltase A3-like n=1 Tax=Adelges cooleyi TaxID=133065 RepID=UPI00217FA444|nr:maltase A3-like [Adelges cooleyi]
MLNVFLCLGLFVSHYTVNTEIIYQGFNSSFVPQWWQPCIIYEVYVRSFKDSNGDGLGDLNGITEKVDYLKNLGVCAVWLSPVFKSPQLDFGYDISNFREIDPIYGTTHDFDRMLEKFHKAGIKVLLDFVPNHTSNMHDWFKKSVKKIDPYTDYFIWKDAKYVDGVRSPPNNWLSVFSGSAWEWSEGRQQYYFHQFLVEQPDLNYRNPKVHEEIKDVMRFWLDRGLDGFRIDAICHVYEKEDFADEPLSGKPGVLPTDYLYLDHPYTMQLPENVGLVKEWDELIYSYKKKESDELKILVLECYAPTKKLMPYYSNDSTCRSTFPFNFNLVEHMDRESDAQDLKTMISTWLINMPEGSWANWVISNHDRDRIASRMESTLLDGIHMIQMMLPGTAITYYGDELGMENSYVRWDQVTDTFALNYGPERFQLVNRDPERSPFPWDDTKNAGFSDASNVWLPIHPNFWADNMKQQSKRKSHLRTYKQLARLRQNPTLIYGDLDMFTLSKWTFGFTRSYKDNPTYVVVVNFGSETETVDLLKFRPTLPAILKVKVSSLNSGLVTGNLVNATSIFLRPKAGLVLITSYSNEV